MSASIAARSEASAAAAGRETAAKTQPSARWRETMKSPGERIQAGVYPVIRQAVGPNGTSASLTVTLAVMRRFDDLMKPTKALGKPTEAHARFPLPPPPQRQWCNAVLRLLSLFAET